MCIRDRGSNSFDEVVSFAKGLKKEVIITRGAKGAMVIKDEQIVECEAKKNISIKDLTGAGDLFAAGYLHGYINKLTLNERLLKGTEMSSKVIQKIGARI